jgi:hypothetical protein
MLFENRPKLISFELDDFDSARKIVLSEDPSSWKIRLAASMTGVTGTFILNIVRVALIYLTDYYGAEA